MFSLPRAFSMTITSPCAGQLTNPSADAFAYLFVEWIPKIVQHLCFNKSPRHPGLAPSREWFLALSHFFNYLFSKFFSEFFSFEPIPRGAVISFPRHPLSFLIPVFSVIIVPLGIPRIGVSGSSWRNWFRVSWWRWWSVLLESPRSFTVEGVKA